MRVELFICVCVVYSAMGQDINAMKDMPKYDSRYDYLDVDAILDSKRLVKNYVECLINHHRCTPEGKDLKRILPEALRTKCVRCTEKQKKTAVKVIKRLKYEYPEEWSKLASRWDPTGDFTRYFEQVLAKEPFNTLYGGGTAAPTTATAPPTTAPPSTATEAATTSQAPPDGSTDTRPVILNRFGDDGELMVESPSSVGTKPSVAPTPTPRPAYPPRPTPTMWTGVASDAMPTRFPMRPVNIPPAYTTAITLFDQIGYKIMRTTELVTDILRNTVRAVVG